MRPPARYAYLDHPGVLAFAHRGGNRHAPENTLAAFADAVAQGYCYLETDVHASKDGVVYAFHDDNLQRMTSDDIAIHALTAKEIDAITLAGGHKISRMADLFEAFPEARFNIDAKTGPVVAPLAKLLIETGKVDSTCIGAFSDSRINKLRRLIGQDICHGVGPRAAVCFRFSAWLRMPVRFSAGCLQLPVSQYGIAMVTRASIEHAHRLGLQVHAWTINDESTMHELLDMGVDGLMSDECVLLKKVLQQRNLWA